MLLERFGPTPRQGTRTTIAAGLVAGAALAAVLQLAPAIAAQHFGGWSAAVPVDEDTGAVNTTALEGCPIESPDGLTLFFASNRPAPAGLGGINIWVAQRESPGGPWGEPQVLPAPVNSEVDDFCPTALPGNRLMFVSRRHHTECPTAIGAGGPTNIFETRLHPVHGWLEPRPLPCDPAGVNSSGNEFSPSLVEDGGAAQLFFSSDRLGLQDLYVSLRQPDGQWGPAARIEELSSAFEDARPNVRKDGLEIVFDSTRGGGPPDIYVATRTGVTAPWSEPQPLGPEINSSAGESRPSLSRDGTRLYFGSTRLPGRSSDIFVATRSGPGHQ
jgi:hypothetical protein